MDLSESEELYHGLGQYAQKKLGFNKPPTLHLVSDTENASKALGKTAYYDPQGMAVTIYTDNRHTKDILRSLAHELVHHTQNENGMLNDTGYHGQGYAQKNKDLRQSEKEAYLKGNMCFRDWEDSLKQSKPTIYNEWRNIMSIKKWKNNELMENLSEKFRFKMNLKALNESNKKQYDHAPVKEEQEEFYHAHSGQDQRGYLLPTGEFLPLGSPEAKKHEAELLKGFRMKNTIEKPFPSQLTPHDPKKMRTLGDDGESKPAFPDLMKEEEDKKPDEDGDGVPDYADKKPGKDDHKEDKKKSSKPKKGVVPPQFQKKEAKNESRIMKIIKNEIRKQLKERK